MKKYMFGLLAIVFAVSAVAFTSPVAKKDVRVTYYFQASNTQTLANCSSVTFTYPTQIPTQNPGTCSGSTNVCWLGFSNYIYDAIDEVYKPSNNGTSEALPCAYTANVLKP